MIGKSSGVLTQKFYSEMHVFSILARCNSQYAFKFVKCEGFSFIILQESFYMLSEILCFICDESKIKHSEKYGAHRASDWALSYARHSFSLEGSAHICLQQVLCHSNISHVWINNESCDGVTCLKLTPQDLFMCFLLCI